MLVLAVASFAAGLAFVRMGAWPVCGLFGATAASAKIRKANAEQHRHALGLTLPLVGGTWASIHHHDSSVRAIRDGLNTQFSNIGTQISAGS